MPIVYLRLQTRLDASPSLAQGKLQWEQPQVHARERRRELAQAPHELHRYTVCPLVGLDDAHRGNYEGLAPVGHGGQGALSCVYQFPFAFFIILCHWSFDIVANFFFNKKYFFGGT